MVDGETYEWVKSFCYLGDTLDGDGGVDLAATARIRNGWMKFRELLPFLTSRDERSSVCQLCQKQHDYLFKVQYPMYIEIRVQWTI